VLKWRNEFRPELKSEGYSPCTVETGELVLKPQAAVG